MSKIPSKFDKNELHPISFDAIRKILDEEQLIVDEMENQEMKGIRGMQVQFLMELNEYASSNHHQVNYLQWYLKGVELGIFKDNKITAGNYCLYLFRRIMELAYNLAHL